MALQEILGHSVRAAVAADQRYVGTRDAAGMREGLAVWEPLVGSGAPAQAAPESLLDAQLAVSALFARRQGAGDPTLALRHLHDAQRHVAPGSFADLEARMSPAETPRDHPARRDAELAA